MRLRKHTLPDAQSGRQRLAMPMLLSPLTVEEALRGAMETGKPPEPANRQVTRTATKRRIKP